MPDEAGIGLTPQSLAKAGLRVHPLRVLASDDQQLDVDVAADAEGGDELRGEVARDLPEEPLVATDLLVQGEPAAGDRAQGVLAGCGDVGDGPGPQGGAAADEDHLAQPLELLAEARPWCAAPWPEGQAASETAPGRPPGAAGGKMRKGAGMRAIVARLRPWRAPYLMIAACALALAALLLVDVVATTVTPV